VELHWFNSPQAAEQEQAKFMVLTSGNCGAIWFAQALNLHPDIFTGCGIDHPIESCVTYELIKDPAPFLTGSTPRNYRFGAHPEVMERLLREHGVTIAVPPRDVTRLPWYLFDELEEMPGMARRRAVGSIHASTAVQFAECFAKDPHILGNRRVVVTNMIRHPVPRTESFLKAFVKYLLGEWKLAIDDYIESNLFECRALERTYGISMEDPRVRAVICTHRIGKTVAWIANELRAFPDMLALRMEDLQSDPEYFASAVEVLTSGRVVADEAYLSEVFKPENLAGGRRDAADGGSRPAGAAEQWAAWSDFERAEFLAMCVRDRVTPVYEAYGYDFSFFG
jgi:hypothetical protein